MADFPIEKAKETVAQALETLKPSDSQHHVRIACFIPDGKVGNDAEILAAVQKHLVSQLR